MKLDNLQTPSWVYEPLGKIDLDPCAGQTTTIGTENIRLEDGKDGLSVEWNGFVFCNPPFSKKEVWAQRMINYGNGILLLPERGSAPWFGPLAKQAGAYFVMGKKINFIGGPSSNNLGSVLFLFGKEAVERVKFSRLPGHLVYVHHFTPRSTNGKQKERR